MLTELGYCLVVVVNVTVISHWFAPVRPLISFCNCFSKWNIPGLLKYAKHEKRLFFLPFPPRASPIMWHRARSDLPPLGPAIFPPAATTSVPICAHPGRLLRLLLGFVPPVRTVFDPHTAFTWLADIAVKAGPWPVAREDTDTRSSKITAELEEDLEIMVGCVCVNVMVKVNANVNVNVNVNEQDLNAVALKYVSNIVQCTHRVSTIELHKCATLLCAKSWHNHFSICVSESHHVVISTTSDAYAFESGRPNRKRSVRHKASMCSNTKSACLTVIRWVLFKEKLVTIGNAFRRSALHFGWLYAVPLMIAFSTTDVVIRMRNLYYGSLLKYYPWMRECVNAWTRPVIEISRAPVAN